MHMHSNQQGITEEEIMQMRKTKVVKLLQLYKLQYFRLQVRFLMINASSIGMAYVAFYVGLRDHVRAGLLTIYIRIVQ